MTLFTSPKDPQKYCHQIFSHLYPSLQKWQQFISLKYIDDPPPQGLGLSIHFKISSRFRCLLNQFLNVYLSELYVRFDFEFDVDRFKTKDHPPLKITGTANVCGLNKQNNRYNIQSRSVYCVPFTQSIEVRLIRYETSGT